MEELYENMGFTSNPFSRFSAEEEKEYLEDIFSISHKRSLMALLYFMRLLPELHLELTLNVYTIWNNANVC